MIKNFTADDVPPQTGKVFFITGANTGIGFETAKVLASKGARVLMGCRSARKGELAASHIRASVPWADLRLIEIDLGDLASVRRAAAEVETEPSLDGLLNNAGIMVPPRQLTKDGFESQFGVNYLGHFALNGLLLPKLHQTLGSRIVCTSSNAHRSGEIAFDDLAAEQSYSRISRYSMSKLANLLHMYELDRRLRARGWTTIAVGVHPGVSNTELTRHLPVGLYKVLRPALGLILSTPAEGAWSTLLAATAPGVKGGKYYGPGGLFEMRGAAREVASTHRARDPVRAKRLWEVSVQLTGVNPPL